MKKRVSLGALWGIGVGVFVILGCLLVAGWMLYITVNPWAGSLAEIRRTQHRGSKYYRMDHYSSSQYEHIQEAARTINKKMPEQAIKHIETAQAKDPKNPVFDYLRAALAYDEGNVEQAAEFINAGNNKKALRLCATSRISPERWQWAEIGIIDRLSRQISTDPKSNKALLTAAVLMSDKIIWCEPPDIVRLLEGLNARQQPTERLLAIANKEQDKTLALHCQSILDEGQSFRKRLRGHFLMRGKTEGGTRAWILGRALHDKDPEFRKAAWLTGIDMQAEWADRMRREQLRIKITEEYLQ
jgi:hypothetical protein